MVRAVPRGCLWSVDSRVCLGVGGEGCGLGRGGGGGQQRGAKAGTVVLEGLIDSSLLGFPCWWCTLKAGGLKVLDTKVFKGPHLWSESPVLTFQSRIPVSSSLLTTPIPTPRLIRFLLFRCTALPFTGH